MLAWIPPWVSAITSVTALIIAALAYRRSGSPALPQVWTTFVGSGPKGWTINLHIHNDTRNTIQINEISPIQGIDRIKWPPKNGEYDYDIGAHIPVDQDWSISISLDKEIPPNGSLVLGIVLPTTSAKCRAKPCILLSIMTTSRKIKKKTIAVPIITPDAIHKA